MTRYKKEYDKVVIRNIKYKLHFGYIFRILILLDRPENLLQRQYSRAIINSGSVMEKTWKEGGKLKLTIQYTYIAFYHPDKTIAPGYNVGIEQKVMLK